jgi:hypothetical protein
VRQEEEARFEIRDVLEMRDASRGRQEEEENGICKR